MDLNALNSAQKEAVTYTSGPLLIVAGAGTGKTTVITKKIAHLIEEGHATPEEILALTFTEKAAAEMQQRVDESLDVGYADLHISTFHSFAQSLLEEYGLHIGLPDSSRLLTQTDAWLLMHKHIYDFDLDYFRPMGNPYRHIHALIAHFQKCKDELISPEKYMEYAEAASANKDTTQIIDKSVSVELAKAFHAYQQMLLNDGSMDFADLQYYALKLLEERPNISKVLSSKYKYVLVDEFQDVNWAQYRLVQLLSTGGQLCVVGDDDQSIYAFRGASVANILRFHEDYPDARDIVLTENYRSGQKILDVSYASVQHNNPDRLEEKLSINKELTSNTEDGGSVVHEQFPTVFEEAEFVTNKIVALHEEGIPLHEIAILVRANAHSRPFLETLKRKGIPTYHVAASGLFRQPIIMDAINALRCVYNLSDSLSLFHVLRMSSIAFPPQDLQSIIYHAKKKSQWYWHVLGQAEALPLSDLAKKKSSHVVGVLNRALQKAQEERPSAILYYLFEKLGVFATLTAVEAAGDSSALREIQYTKQFFDLISTYEQEHVHVRVPELLHYLELLDKSGDTGSIQPFDHTLDAVQIMTVHASKGLEFDAVFVVNMVQDRFPTRRRGGDIEIPLDLVNEQLPEGDFHLQEERRLFYVAVTRARTKVYLTSADSYGGVRKKKVSKFIHEIEGLLESNVTSVTTKKGFEDPSHARELQHAKDLPLPKTFSFSQIRSYQTCPYQYKLSHIVKLPMKGSASFSFGNTIHNTLERFYKKVRQLNTAQQVSLFDSPAKDMMEGIQIPPVEDLLATYENCWIPDWYETKQQRKTYKTKGKKLLIGLYNRHEKEQSWHVPLFLESSFRIKIDNYTITGKIDRVDKLADGSLEIIDYKTGQAKEALSTDDKDQLLLYQIAAESLPQYINEGGVSKLTFHYVNEDIRTGFLGTQKDKERVTKKVTKTLDAIHERDFTAKPSKQICGRCDFRNICPYKV